VQSNLEDETKIVPSSKSMYQI